MILLIDNYDSFTYNLYQYLCELGAEVSVVRNDKITLGQLRNMNPEKLLSHRVLALLIRPAFQMRLLENLGQ